MTTVTVPTIIAANRLHRIISDMQDQKFACMECCETCGIQELEHCNNNCVVQENVEEMATYQAHYEAMTITQNIPKTFDETNVPF